jgi:hypothetical protein
MIYTDSPRTVVVDIGDLAGTRVQAWFFDPADGSIGGRVTNYFNPSSGVDGAEVSITGGPTGVGNLPTGTNGAYVSLANLEQGTYTVKVVPPAGYLVLGDDTKTIEIALDGTHNTIATGVDFVLYPVAVSSSAYTTFRQAGWGTRPRGDNAGALLERYFSLLYPDGLVIGIPNDNAEPCSGPFFSITETSQDAVQDFLPQEGKPRALNCNYVDPPARLKMLQHRKKLGHHRKLGALAGETLALELNVRFSAWGLTRAGLGSLKLAKGKLAGWTVDQVLAAANKALGGGGLPAGMTNYDQLEDIVELINENFRGGAINRGYLIVP